MDRVIYALPDVYMATAVDVSDLRRPRTHHLVPCSVGLDTAFFLLRGVGLETARLSHVSKLVNTVGLGWALQIR